MLNTIKTLTLIGIIILMSSFAGTNVDKFVGTYGVSSADPSQIKLQLNADGTFYYQDFSITTKKVVQSGVWEARGNRVVLDNRNTEFHSIWTFHQDGQVTKSRKGITFYRLCKVD